MHGILICISYFLGCENFDQDDLIDRVISGIDSIESFEVSYVSHASNSDSFLQRHIVALRPGFLLHTNSHGSQFISPQYDLLAQKTVIAENRSITRYLGNRATYFHDLKDKKDLPGTMGEEFLFHSLGIWLFDDFEPGQRFGKTIDLSRLLADCSEIWKVTKATNNFNDQNCFLISNATGTVSIWVTLENGQTAIRKKVLRDSNQAIEVESRFEEFKNIDHVSLPSKIIQTTKFLNGHLWHRLQRSVPHGS